MGNKGSKSDLDENEYNEIYGGMEKNENYNSRHHSSMSSYNKYDTVEKKMFKIKRPSTGKFSVIKVEKANDYIANDIDFDVDSHKLRPVYSNSGIQKNDDDSENRNLDDHVNNNNNDNSTTSENADNTHKNINELIEAFMVIL